MNMPSADNDADTLSELSNVASWNRERTTEELLEFITRHESSLPDTVDA